VTRVEIPADETVTYTADPIQDNLLTVHRTYDLVSSLKQDGVSTDKTHGEGTYVFDLATGRIKSLAWQLTDELIAKNIAVRLPITVTAKLLTNDEVTAIKNEIDAQAAKNPQSAPTPHAGFGRNAGDGSLQARSIPDGMQATAILGTTTGGGPFSIISPERLPVIGFRIRTDEFMNRRCFRVLEPLFKKQDADSPAVSNTATQDGSIILLARDGYAVGSVTVNAGEFLNALCVTFMKKTDTGLDPKTSYVSPWYGEKVGDSQTKLAGDGKLIYGICGRKGLNVDTLGLLTAAPAADEGEKK
jgi:hypothetical protein